jgi:hypothetical protein
MPVNRNQQSTVADTRYLNLTVRITHREDGTKRRDIEYAKPFAKGFSLPFRIAVQALVDCLRCLGYGVSVNGC